jgi:CBS domain-containing protein
MRVHDIMTSPVVTVQPETTLADLARLLIAHRISGTPVVDDAGTLVGMVTEADLVMALEVGPADRIQPATTEPVTHTPPTVADVMRTEVFVVEEQAPVSEVANIMVHRNVRRVPVVRDGAVVGVVSRRDVIGTLTRSDDEIAADVQELLDDVIQVLGRFRSSVVDGLVTLSGPDDPKARHAATATARSVPGVIDVRFADAPSATV